MSIPQMDPPSAGGGGGGGSMEQTTQQENAQMLTMAIAVALQNHGDKSFNKVATSTFSNFRYRTYEMHPETSKSFYWTETFMREVIIPSEITVNAQLKITSDVPDPERPDQYLPLPDSQFLFLGLDSLITDIQMTLNDPSQFQEYTLKERGLKSMWARVFNDKASQLRDQDKRFQICSMDTTYPPQMDVDQETQVLLHAIIEYNFGICLS